MCSELSRTFVSSCARLLHKVNTFCLPYIARTVTARGFTVSLRHDRQHFRSRMKFSKRQPVAAVQTPWETETREDPENTDPEDEFAELENIVRRDLYIGQRPHSVLVVEPNLWRRRPSNRLTTPELRLDEAVTLIRTLRHWKVVDKTIINVKRAHGPRFFGVGHLEEIKELIRVNRGVTAVFVNTSTLRPSQQIYLQNYLRLPVYDRYTVVIHIFREHAQTREAKLQIKLSELPYLWSRINTSRFGSGSNFAGGALCLGSKWRGKEFHRQLLRDRLVKIEAEIERLKEHQKTIRKNRIRNEIPVVAVVGYTNSGKTALIKALTGREKLEPQNYLFATLDVSIHKGVLPSNVEVFFVDTIGFMSDLPKVLFRSFLTTLEDALSADVIIHVRDLSHPDNLAQNQNVLETLEILEVPEDLRNNIITVGNKIDLVAQEELLQYKDEGMIMVSALQLTGTDYLRQKIEESVLKVTGRIAMTMKVRSGGEEYMWLQENTAVVDETPFVKDNQYTLIKVIISEVALAKFKHRFIKEYYKSR